MFDHLIRELNQLNGSSLSMPVMLDSGGFLDRLCPTPDCASSFKIHLADLTAYRETVASAASYCPFCRHEDEFLSFCTPEQTAYIRDAALAQVMGRIGEAMHADARQFNRRPQRGFITMKLDVTTPAQQIVVPPASEDAMTMQLSCDRCGCRFAVVGAGYFCPVCGHNSATHTFGQALMSARNAIAAIPEIRDSIADADIAAQVISTLIESNIGALVTAFQRFAEAAYPHLPASTVAPRRNAFQNPTEGSLLWAGAGGTSYEAILNAPDMEELKRLFQTRHVLAHQQGIVDQEYIAKTGDARYAVGQRLRVREQDVLRLATLLEQLTTGMHADLPTKL